MSVNVNWWYFIVFNPKLNVNDHLENALVCFKQQLKHPFLKKKKKNHQSGLSLGLSPTSCKSWWYKSMDKIHLAVGGNDCVCVHVCVCVCVWGREGKKEGDHPPPAHHHSTILFKYFFASLDWCEVLWNQKLSSKQNRPFTVKGWKSHQKKRCWQWITPWCLCCWSKCEWYHFLSLREKYCRNPSPHVS